MRLIDADALIKQIEDNICKPCRKRKGDYKGVRCRACQYGDEIDDIDSAPTAQPTIEERKTGEWTSENACEFCGFQPWYENDIHTLSFCPNCGADMR